MISVPLRRPYRYRRTREERVAVATQSWLGRRVDPALIVRMVREGGTGLSVGAELGISRERVRQVWKRETGERLPTADRVHERHVARMARLAESRTCRDCGAHLTGPYWVHRKQARHPYPATSQHKSARNEAFVAHVRATPDRTVADLSAEFGITAELGRRILHGAAVFRRGEIDRNRDRNAALVMRAKDPRSTRNQLAAEFGLSPTSVYHLLRIARAKGEL